MKPEEIRELYGLGQGMEGKPTTFKHTITDKQTYISTRGMVRCQLIPRATTLRVSGMRYLQLDLSAIQLQQSIAVVHADCSRES